MSATESNSQMIDERKIAKLREIFDLESAIVSDEDLQKIAQYVEDESMEIETVVDHDFDFGDGM